RFHLLPAGETLNPSCIHQDPTCVVINPSATNVAAVFQASSTTATSTFAGNTQVSGNGLSITHNFGPSDGSQFQIRQTRQSSPHHQITWCWIPRSIKVTA